MAFLTVGTLRWFQTARLHAGGCALIVVLMLVTSIGFATSLHTAAWAEDATGPQVRALVIALNRATISAEIVSRVTSMPVRPGVAFKKGDRLVRFACDRYSAQRDTGAADLDAAKKSLASIEKLVSLNSAGTLEAEIAAARVARAEAQLRLFQADVDRCSIRAPFSGRVVKWHANPHEVVELGGEILDIYSDEDLELEMIVPSAWLAWIEPDIEVSLLVDETGDAYQARVTVTDAEVDPVSQTIKVRARFSTPPEALIPGMSGVAIFPKPDGS